MNATCSKLIICERWVEVEVARCSGPDVCQRLPKCVNVFVPRPGSAGTCRLCWGHECQMSSTANSLLSAPTLQHFMFTFNAAVLNGGSAFPSRRRPNRGGERALGLEPALPAPPLFCNFLCFLRSLQSWRRARRRPSVWTCLCFLLSTAPRAEGRPGRAGSKNSDIQNPLECHHRGSRGHWPPGASWGLLFPAPCLHFTLDTMSVSHVSVGRRAGMLMVPRPDSLLLFFFFCLSCSYYLHLSAECLHASPKSPTLRQTLRLPLRAADEPHNSVRGRVSLLSVPWAPQTDAERAVAALTGLSASTITGSTLPGRFWMRRGFSALATISM